MKAVILAGGLGSRLSEETVLRPKPMVEVGGQPILWHIMNICAAHGVTEFVIALGYKSEVIKQYFLNFYAYTHDVSVDLGTGATVIHKGRHPNWQVHLVDTGLHTQTGGRLKRLRRWVEDDAPFLFTYGDGVADLDITSLVAFHRHHGRLATVTTVRSPARFGRITFNGGPEIVQFNEKPDGGEGWINGGYFVLEAGAIDYIDDDTTVWEKEPVERLARAGQLMGFQHGGFWSCMDTLKERNLLEQHWDSGTPPWRIWSA
jgi:glucose-1-phosphate cytidylyltransferase